MRRILAIAWNDMRIELSDRTTLIFFLLLPLVFTTIIGFALRNLYGSADSSGDKRLAVVVVDLDQGTYAQQLIANLNQSDVIRPVLQSETGGLAFFEDNNLPGLLTIPAGFSQALVQGRPVQVSLLQPSSGTAGFTAQEAIAVAVRRLNSAFSIADQSVSLAQNIQAFSDPSNQAAYYQQSFQQAEELLGQAPVNVVTTQSQSTNFEIPSGFEQSSPGQLVTWVLITLLSGSEVFVNERLGGTLRRLMITPNRKAAILSGKILARFGLGLIQMVLMIGFGALVLKVNWGRSLSALAVMLLTFGLAGTALGVFLGAIARTRSQANGFSIVFSLLLSALGGAWWPLEITPAVYQKVVQILPTTWAMKGFSDVIVRGQGVAGILPEAGILLGFAVLFFVLGIGSSNSNSHPGCINPPFQGYPERTK